MTQIFECDHCDYRGVDVWHDDDTGLALCHGCSSTKAEWATGPEASMKQEEIISKLTTDIDEFLNDRYAEYVVDDILDAAWEQMAIEALERVRGMFGTPRSE